MAKLTVVVAVPPGWEPAAWEQHCRRVIADICAEQGIEAGPIRSSEIEPTKGQQKGQAETVTVEY